MNEEWSQIAANAIAHWSQMAGESVRVAASSYERPSVLYRPKLSIDGNQWCALYGDNLQDGCAGFGNTPADAMWDFDRNWQTANAAIAKAEGRT
jgi:hypothetical protein